METRALIYSPTEILGFWTNGEKAISPTERLDRIIALNACNKALEQVFLGKMRFMDYLDICESYGVKIDSYVANMIFNLKAVYGIDPDKLPD